MNNCSCFYRSGHEYDDSLVQFTEEALLVLKHLLLNAADAADDTAAIGALYLMYAVYFKQPTRQYCKFRCTQPEWQRIHRFYTALSEPHHQQARLILWKLIGADAFRFVECEKECGFETYLLAGQQQSVRRGVSIEASITGELRSLRCGAGGGCDTGLVPALQLLQAGYNEMKGHLNGGAMLTPTNVMDGIVASMANIERIFDLKRTAERAESDGDEAALEKLVDYSIGERRQRLKAGFAVLPAVTGAPVRATVEPNELTVRQEKAKRVYMRRRERALKQNEADMADVRRVDEAEEAELLISCKREREQDVTVKGMYIYLLVPI